MFKSLLYFFWGKGPGNKYFMFIAIIHASLVHGKRFFSQNKLKKIFREGKLENPTSDRPQLRASRRRVPEARATPDLRFTYILKASNDPEFGHPALISSFTKILHVKNSFSTIVNELSGLKLFQR